MSASRPAILVVFEDNITDERAEFLCQTFKQFNGVLSAEPAPSGAVDVEIATQRVWADVRKRLVEAFFKK